MGTIITWIIILLLYFVPTIAANKKQNVGAIFVLNLLLGWTILGWIGALVWAMASKESVQEIL